MRSILPVLVLSGASFAAPIPPGLFAPAQVTAATLCVTDPCESGGTIIFQSIQGESLGVAFSSAWGGGPYNGKASASAGLAGGLKAFGALGLPSYTGTTALFQLATEATFRDILTVDDPNAAFIVYTIDVSAAYLQNEQKAGQVDTYGDFTISTRNSPTSRTGWNQAIPNGGGVYTSPAHPIVGGQPFNLTVNLFTLVTIQPFADGVAAPGDLNGTADLGNSVYLTGLQVLDSTGSPLTNYRISSSLGFVYGPGGISTVPEPGTFALVAPLAAFAAYRMGRTKKTDRRKS